MKNQQRKGISTKKPLETKKEKQISNPQLEQGEDQYMRIALDIIEVVQNELNMGDSQSLLKNYMDIIKTLQSEVNTQFERNKYQSQIEETFNKNYEVITNYFIKCLQIFDNVKINSIENLKTCLTQLFQIVSNELSKKDTNVKSDINQANQELIMQTNQVLITQEEKFVYLINSLSSAIKSYMKNTKNMIKDLLNYSETLSDNISQCKMSLNDLMIQASLPSIGKSSLKVFKDRTNSLIEKTDTYLQINTDLQQGIKQIDAYGLKFYDEAKDIFRKLKQHHNQKMNDIKKVNIDYGLMESHSNVNLINQKQMQSNIYNNNRRNQSVSPTKKRLLNNIINNSNTRNNNNNINSNNNNSNKDNNNFTNEFNQSNSNSNTLIKETSKSTEHYKAKTIAGKTRQSNSSNYNTSSTKTNKQSNMSNSTNANNISHYDTSPNFYVNTNNIVNELNEKNQLLLSQMDILNDENKKLKLSIAGMKKMTEVIQTKSMPKSKSLRNFLNNNSNVTHSTNTNQNCNNDINNIQNNLFFHQPNPQTPTQTQLQLQLQPQEDNTLFIDSTCKQLADGILLFLNSMKELQNSICKKVNNVNELKKDFEKQKKELFHFASVIQSATISLQNKTQTKETKDTKAGMGVTGNSELQVQSKDSKVSNGNLQLKEELNKMKKITKNNETIINNLNEEVNKKSNELAKMALELQRITNNNNNENNKKTSPQIKVKDLENKIQLAKGENDELKTINTNLEAKIAELVNAMNQQTKQRDKDKKPIEQAITKLTKENEELKGMIDDIKAKNNKLHKTNEELNESILKMTNTHEGKVKLIINDKEESDLKYKTSLTELSTKTQEIISLTQIKLDLEKEKKEITSKLTTLQNELKEVKKSNDKLKGDNDKHILSITQLEKQNIEYKTMIDLLKSNNVNHQDDLNHYKDELNKQKDKEHNALIDLKAKLALKENEVNELKKLQLTKTDTKEAKEDKGTKDKDKEKDNMKRKNDIISQLIKDTPSFRKEFIEVSQMLHQITKEINEKYKELRIALSYHEMRKNPNEAMLINEEDEDFYDQDNDNDNDNEQSNNNNNNIDLNSLKRLDNLMNRNTTDYNEIRQTIILVFKLIEKHFKSEEEVEGEEINTHSDKKRNKKGKNKEKEKSIQDNKRKSGSADNNSENNDKKTIIELQTEINNLKSFFTECTNTIFDAIKDAAPHMVDDESELSLNIVSGANAPVNLLDSKDSPFHSGKNSQQNPNSNVNVNVNPNPNANASANQPVKEFDPELVSLAVSKFKMYNNEINEQLKKFEMEKEEFEREAHNNLVKAQAYKTALDDAIMKINSNPEDILQLNKGINNNSINSGNLPRDNARTFTVEDLENPQSDHNNNNTKQKNDMSIGGTSSKLDYKKINTDLMLIQSDLLKKMERKEEECQKLQETINHLLKGKDSKDSDMQVSGGKYKQLLLLYTSEQDKNHELRSSYYTLLNEFSDFVNNKGKRLNDVPLSNAKHEITLGNDDNDDDNEHEGERDVDGEDEANSNSNKGKEDSFALDFKPNSNSKENKSKGTVKKGQEKGKEKEHLDRNLTHNQIKSLNHKENYLGLLNDKDLMSNHSASMNNDINIQELLNENKNLEEQEKLLMTQLQAVKKELKETREQVKILSEENNKLKTRSSSGVNVVDKRDILEPLKNALEKLIFEMTFTPKVKELMTVILKVLGYGDDKILEIYHAKEKKKGFFNLFK